MEAGAGPPPAPRPGLLPGKRVSFGFAPRLCTAGLTVSSPSCRPLVEGSSGRTVEAGLRPRWALGGWVRSPESRLAGAGVEEAASLLCGENEAAQVQTLTPPEPPEPSL